jgi:hypothetical protein
VKKGLRCSHEIGCSFGGLDNFKSRIF